MVTKAERKKALENNTKDLAKWLKANKEKKTAIFFMKLGIILKIEDFHQTQKK